jgi:hypothetical protein
MEKNAGYAGNAAQRKKYTMLSKKICYITQTSMNLHCSQRLAEDVSFLKGR